MILIQEIKKQLVAGLQATVVEVHDESAAHFGHRESQKNGGGHYRVFIVSSSFIGKNRLQRHRLVYQILSPWMGRHIHALAIRALTEEEHRRQAQDRTSDLP
jgi:BolA protein